MLPLCVRRCVTSAPTSCPPSGATLLQVPPPSVAALLQVPPPSGVASFKCCLLQVPPPLGVASFKCCLLQVPPPLGVASFKCCLLQVPPPLGVASFKCCLLQVPPPLGWPWWPVTSWSTSTCPPRPRTACTAPPASGGWATRVVSVCEEREEFVVQHVAQELGVKMARLEVVEGSLGPYEGRIEYRVLSDEGLAARYL
ncbi:unnamed protein product [Closterium sp. NIES-64]|nr:unnamed protein product [Closterium sp. NIES-64]